VLGLTRVPHRASVILATWRMEGPTMDISIRPSSIADLHRR
jgi:hypothetical protein